MQAMWSQAGSDALLNSWLNIFCFFTFSHRHSQYIPLPTQLQVPYCLVEAATDEWREKRQPNQALWITYAKEALAAFPLGSPWGTGWQQGGKAEPPS